MTGRKGYPNVLNCKGEERDGIIWGGRRLLLKFLKQQRGQNKMTLRNFGNLTLNWEGVIS